MNMRAEMLICWRALEVGDVVHRNCSEIRHACGSWSQTCRGGDAGVKESVHNDFELYHLNLLEKTRLPI
jgi:hypothetical protein